jgi:ParB family transcriptional regulator, chromosome partitioning protein
MAMKNRPKGLGMGLDALLGPRVADAPSAQGSDGPPSVLKLAQLQPGKYQPRTRMDEGALYELAESIKSQGVMQPILVRPLGAQGRQAANMESQGPSPATGALSTAAGASRYEIIAGERRFRAAKLAGLDEVPVLVKAVPDEAAAVMALIENIQREDLNPLEEAQGLKRLVDEFGLTHEQAAQAVGRSRSAASNLLRLLNLTPPVQQMLLAGDLEMGHARALLALDAAQQILSANEVGARKLSVRETEVLVARTLGQISAGGARTAAPAPAKSRDITRLEEALADKLTASVEIRVRRGHAGEVAIAFGSLDELNGLLDKLGVRDR